jgi:hypothetical protein
VVLAMILESGAALPAEAEDVVRQAEFGAIIIDGNVAVGFSSLVPYHGEGEA